MPDQNLLLNQTTVNNISLNKLKNVLYIPNSAVYSDRKATTYVISEDGTKTHVKIERGNENFTVVDSGLTEGQRIINNASNSLINTEKN
jgi:multidrug efflux pump subunit AcrA (membrane-fusion protein)